MIDSIGSNSGARNAHHAQATSNVPTLRNNPAVLNAIVQTQQKASSATNLVSALAVPQTSKSGNSSNVKLPRGSLVDVLA